MVKYITCCLNKNICVSPSCNHILPPKLLLVLSQLCRHRISSRLRKKKQWWTAASPNLFGGYLNMFLYHLIPYFGYFGSLPPAPHEQIFLKIAYAKPTLCRYTLPKKTQLSAAFQIFKNQETPSLETSNFPSARWFPRSGARSFLLILGLPHLLQLPQPKKTQNHQSSAMT